MNGGLTAIIPVRGRKGGKTRLSGYLLPHERVELVRILANRVIGVVIDSGVAERVVLVTRDPEYAGTMQEEMPGIEVLIQPESIPGLNAGLEYARETFPAAAHLVLFADLPLIASDDVRAIAESESDVTIARDRHGTGTNALLLRGQRAGEFRLAFGAMSHHRHLDEARRSGLHVADANIPHLRFDLDTVEDWFDLPVFSRIDLTRKIGISGERAGLDDMLIVGNDGERYTG